MIRSVTPATATTDSGRGHLPPRGLSLVPLLLLIAWGWGGDAIEAPPLLEAFDFSKGGGIQEKLPRALQEISGLAISPQGKLFAHHDERAVIYEVDPESGSVLKAFSAGSHGVRGDFEGIAVVDDRVFLSTSTGELLETREGEAGSAMEYRIHRTRLSGLCEFEGLAYDAGTNSLLLPCKKVRTRELEGHLVVFAVRLDSMEPYHVPHVFIPLQALEEFDLKDVFRPSAIEVHPATRRILLVSAQDKVVLEISPDGRLLGGRKLHRKTHSQTEGITFLPDGTLLLADEGQGKRGRLTRYLVRGTDEGGAT